MDFQLINQELNEARLYRGTRNFNTFNGKDIANMLYLNTLSVYLLSGTDAAKSYAENYAKRTSQFGSYAIFRTHATDIYMLAYQVANPNNDHANLADAFSSKKFLNSLNFADKRHVMFMRKMSNGFVDSGEAHSVIQRLETQLKITDSRYKSWRRNIIGWESASDSRKKKTLTALTQEISRIGKGTGRSSELVPSLKTQSHKTSVMKKHPTDEPSTLRKVAGAAAGAAAGRYAAGKMKKMSTGKAKNIGTGIGAIAGYWAGSRRPQK